MLRYERISLTVLSVLILASSVFFGSTLVAAESEPYLYVLGVAQDAGYPQAGCYEPHCMPGWEQAELKRTATALALVDPQLNRHYLFEATPNLPEQLYELQKEVPLSRGGLDGVFLTHAHIGHYAGLMYFGREAMNANAVSVYVMPRMADFLRTNGPWSQLVGIGNIELRQLTPDLPIDLSIALPSALASASESSLSVTPLLVPHRDEYSETVGFRIQGPSRTALFIPDINKWKDWNQDIVELVRGVDYALLDATFFADGELGNRDMSQIPHPFAAETMALFAGLPAAERAKIWFIHFNHTNPLLNLDSPESQSVLDAGYHIAHEGVKLPL